MNPATMLADVVALTNGSRTTKMSLLSSHDNLVSTKELSAVPAYGDFAKAPKTPFAIFKAELSHPVTPTGVDMINPLDECRSVCSSWVKVYEAETWDFAPPYQLVIER